MSLKSDSDLSVQVPGSVANLGGGFDTLGVAINLYLRARIVDIRDDGGSRLEVVHSTPPVRGNNAVERAFAAIARRTGVRAPTVQVEVTSEIPMAAGLGSSAAATVAGIRLFERVTGALAGPVMLGAAVAVEGHADNAAPALFGGLTSVLEVEGDEPLALRWAWPDDLQLIVSTPSAGLATARARAALLPQVARTDAVFNLQRALSLVHALQGGDYGRLRESVKDRWHQPARAALVPLLAESLAVEDADVLGVFLSGAGPSIAWLVRRDSGRVARLVQTMYERAAVAAVVRTLSVHQAPPEAAPYERPAAVMAAAHGRTA